MLKNQIQHSNYSVRELVGNQEFSDYNKFLTRYKGISRLKFLYKVYKGKTLAYMRLSCSLVTKKCYVGPFIGEYGNFLSYILPFINYLHEKGVKIYFCGNSIYYPLLINEKGERIVHKFYGVRDFFQEAAPGSNSAELPADVEHEVQEYKKRAERSFFSFWDLSDPFYYWFVHRTWILSGPYYKPLRLDKYYRTVAEDSVVIFPRSKGAASTPNNGDPWDYEGIVDEIKHYFDTVYVVGHPAFSVPIKERDNIKTIITPDNAEILKICSNSKLIISQHSGTVYLGNYTNSSVLLIFKGELPIKGINDTLVYNSFLGEKANFSFAFSMQEIINYCKNRKYETA